jgi:hypothetical protein
MTEDELLDRARTAMLKAAALPPDSLGRSIQWAVHDTAMAELRRRALRLTGYRWPAGSRGRAGLGRRPDGAVRGDDDEPCPAA